MDGLGFESARYGTIVFIRSEEGTERCIHTVTNGGCFGELGVLQGHNRFAGCGSADEAVRTLPRDPGGASDGGKTEWEAPIWSKTVSSTIWNCVSSARHMSILPLRRFIVVFKCFQGPVIDNNSVV